MTISASQVVQGSLPDQVGLATGRGERASSTLNNAALAEQCQLQLYAYRRGEPCDESYGLELFHRATVEGDEEAWARVQRCFSDTVFA
jgi:hypothetical protein